MTDNVIRVHPDLWMLNDPYAQGPRSLREEPRVLSDEVLARLPQSGHLRVIPKFVGWPAHGHLEWMLSEFHELRGLDDHNGRVYVWPAESTDHIAAAAILGIPYDPATDHDNGKAFYIRSIRDWFDRKLPPVSESRLRLVKLRAALRRPRRERDELRAQGKMRPERLP
jgi:hypothetical protein